MWQSHEIATALRALQKWGYRLAGGFECYSSVDEINKTCKGADQEIICMGKGIGGLYASLIALDKTEKS